MEKVSLSAALDTVTDHWSPKVVGRVNDQTSRSPNCSANESSTSTTTRTSCSRSFAGGSPSSSRVGRSVEVGPGEFCVMPRGVLHNPVAEEECWIVLIETATTKHTGDVVIPQTRLIEAQLG